MGTAINVDILYTLLFAGDQVVITADVDDVNYMLRTLKEKYGKRSLTVNLSKNEYLREGERNVEVR